MIELIKKEIIVRILIPTHPHGWFSQRTLLQKQPLANNPLMSWDWWMNKEWIIDFFFHKGLMQTMFIFLISGLTRMARTRSLQTSRLYSGCSQQSCSVVEYVLWLVLGRQSIFPAILLPSFILFILSKIKIW